MTEIDATPITLPLMEEREHFASRDSTGPGPGPTLASRSVVEPEETLIPDERAGLLPAQVVEHKLRTRLKGVALPVSYLQRQGGRRAR